MVEHCPICGRLLDPGSDFLWCGVCQEGFTPEDLDDFDEDYDDEELDFSEWIDDPDNSE